MVSPFLILRQLLKTVFSALRSLITWGRTIIFRRIRPSNFQQVCNLPQNPVEQLSTGM
jgi:hypothetical protein